MTYALTPSFTNADRQALHRAKKEADGFQRINIYLSPAAIATVSRVVAETGMSRQDAINYLLQEDTMQPDPTTVSYWQENENDQLTLDAAIAAAPNESVRNAIRTAAAQAAQRHQRQDSPNLSASEKASLETFKIQVAESNVTARHIQAHGGEAAMEQKARVGESWLAGNIHNQGK